MWFDISFIAALSLSPAVVDNALVIDHPPRFLTSSHILTIRSYSFHSFLSIIISIVFGAGVGETPGVKIKDKEENEKRKQT